MIEFENVSFSYEANPKQNSISDLSLTIEDGECVLLTGSSGCGKSTILRLLNGLIPEFYDGKRSGFIRIDGEDISEKGIYDLAGKIGTVFQNPRSQFFNVDTTSEIAFGPENLALPEEEILTRIKETATDFNIENLLDRDIFSLSGGEKQKIACASVDVLKAPLILLDEPSANLDYESAERLRVMVSVWKKEGKTIIIAEHRINYIWDLIDRAIIIEKGRIVCDMKGEEKKNFSRELQAKFRIRSTERISPVKLAETISLPYADDDIILSDFKFSYKKTEIVNIPELRIPKGKASAIVGSNGAGKTTFLQCVCGILKNKGMLKLDGKTYKYRDRRGRIFMVMQDPNHQLFTESVLDEVLISMPDENEQLAREVLEQVDLLEYADRHPMSLSGGQKQRAAIACAVASQCPILLFDEPTSGLDMTRMLQVADIMKKLKAAGRTLITVTHDSEFIENCCDNVIVLKR